MPPSEFANYAIVTFASREGALQAFRGLSDKPFYGFKVLVQVARERAQPYLAVVTFKRLDPEEEMADSEEELDDTEKHLPKRKRIEIDMTKPGWNRWEAAEISEKEGDRNEERMPSRRKRARIDDGIARWNVWRSGDPVGKTTGQKEAGEQSEHVGQPRALSKSLSGPVLGVGGPHAPAPESLEYQIGNLDRKTTVGSLMLFLESHNM